MVIMYWVTEGSKTTEASRMQQFICPLQINRHLGQVPSRLRKRELVNVSCWHVTV